ncbi:MAG TPA: hypothetical protein VG603_11135 [Chitinophagales bacterium]|nr:hypothetical protein [Chitinophagales bacterium]
MQGKKPFGVYFLLLLIAFQALSGLAGGFVLIIKTDGALLHAPLQMLQGSPFKTFLIPGLILLLVLGVFPALTFVLLLVKRTPAFLQYLNIYPNRHPAWGFSLYIGLGLIIWMDVEVALTGFGSVLQVIYAVTGLLILISALLPRVINYYELPGKK